jgi:hypothetical protein
MSSPMTLMFSHGAQHPSSAINEYDLKDSVNASDAKFLLVQEGRVSISGTPGRLSLKTKLDLGSEPALWTTRSLSPSSKEALFMDVSQSQI